MKQTVYCPLSTRKARDLKVFLNLLLALALIAILVWVFAFRPTPIGKILHDPRDYADKTVTVSGNVKEAFGLVFVQYFILEDKTGSIPVVTDKPLPAVGAHLRVRGTVREAFSLGDKQLMVLVERDK